MNHYIYKKQVYNLRVNPAKRTPKFIQESFNSQYKELLNTSNEIIQILTLLKDNLCSIYSLINDYDRSEYINVISDISEIIKIFLNINKTIISNDSYMLSKFVNDCLKIITVDKDLWMKYPLMKFLALYVINISEVNDDLIIENMEMVTKLLNKWNEIQKRNNELLNQDSSTEEIDLSLLDLSNSEN
ncbi:hypothetical protein KM1_332220 [Entamoeba histolytica HM-3:IMSS]|uniref:Uncharacterized protein n=4 Tax=Entamoeba histolytica TaxID=5759 RepID=C4MAU6_ENTH1|nr:hypothetical protein EHI_132870 [Entamoeba histolytica HM-1:IMSS]EAL44458.1 hypothetical protein EHI_132870 [Entamoeba histolytica HM-1:IMSS]EMD47452.1 Hypothetical protein EHI5A_274550 [Entamoeba histolytica KU27]EMS12101.1 hypothetical protein KM1_332220 [Entamoeba histolytica HM-3:IMSS]GAT98978.1 hypothetical protein CL6EHI_132870 [Entamoeba histolytica]|eukprot:XP_649844.1 hypothetical protein EHI_132870 [Entamoeba histolytica HM-1:IMSS]